MYLETFFQLKYINFKVLLSVTKKIMFVTLLHFVMCCGLQTLFTMRSVD